MKLPRVNPKDPIPYKVTWDDAAHDNDHDGPADEAGGLGRLPHLGYHVRTFRDRTHANRLCVVLAAEVSHSVSGVLHSRFEMTIPAAWIVSMTPLVERSPDATQEGNQPGHDLREHRDGDGPREAAEAGRGDRP